MAAFPGSWGCGSRVVRRAPADLAFRAFLEPGLSRGISSPLGGASRSPHHWVLPPSCLQPRHVNVLHLSFPGGGWESGLGDQKWAAVLSFLPSLSQQQQEGSVHLHEGHGDE